MFGEITAAFGLEYTSSTQLTEPIWEIFATHNVPLNAWTYFREFVSSTTGRMGWTHLTIPTYKVMPNETADDTADGTAEEITEQPHAADRPT